MISSLLYNAAVSVREVYTFTATVEWTYQGIQGSLSDTVETKLMGPDLYIDYTSVYSDGKDMYWIQQPNLEHLWREKWHFSCEGGGGMRV